VCALVSLSQRGVKRKVRVKRIPHDVLRVMLYVGGSSTNYESSYFYTLYSYKYTSFSWTVSP